MRKHFRREWKAQPARSVTQLRRDRVTHLFLHHTTGYNPDPAAWLRGIQDFHFGRGWNDIAYSWLVDEDGDAWEGRGWLAAGAHTAGWNSRSVAVAYLGDGGRSVPPAAIDTITILMNEADALFGRKLIRQGHRDVGRTACPGDTLYAWLRADGAPVAQPPPTLRRGSRGGAVREVQAIVGAKPDGIFGPRTEAAVKAFQRRRGLTPDGIVGPLTWTALGKGGNG